MFWKFKRRLRQGVWRFGWYHVSAVIFFILFTNLMVIQRNFATLEGENYIDTGGTRLGQKPEILNFKLKNEGNDFHGGLNGNENTPRHVFENKLRKLLDIMETNLENTVAYGNVAEPEIPVERYFPDRFLDCDDVANISDWVYMASGWTKAVYKGVYRGSPVAIKTVDGQAQGMASCMKDGRLSERACYLQSAKKIVKEIVVLQALANENVLKVLGFCLPRSADDNLWVAMVTELGESVDLIKLLQMSWEDRLRDKTAASLFKLQNFTSFGWQVSLDITKVVEFPIRMPYNSMVSHIKVSLDITKIVEFLSRTPYGSMAMNDFRRQQFVLVDGTLKLSDVDDSGFVDPVCSDDDECLVTFSSANFSQRTRCIKQRCSEFNEKRNVYNAGRDFVTFLLPHGAPALLRPLIGQLVDGFSNLTMTSSQLLAGITKIKELYQSGWYMNRTADHGVPKTTYRKLERSDLAGLHDYRCRFSLSVVGCTVSVFDQSEAEDVCNMDDECRAFVMSSSKTWTGRTLVHLKNAVDSPTFNVNTTLFLKPS